MNWLSLLLLATACIALVIIVVKSICRDTSIMDVKAVSRAANEASVNVGGYWMPARPMGYASFRYRCKAAWLVFTGRADALKWPGGQ